MAGITVKQRTVLIELEATHGEVSSALRNTKTGRRTFDKWMAFDTAFRKRVEAIEDVVLDFVESKLFGLIAEGDHRAIIFYLRTKGRRRGYVVKDEVEVTQVTKLTADLKFDFSKLPTDDLRTLRQLARRSRPTGKSDSGGVQDASE